MGRPDGLPSHLEIAKHRNGLLGHGELIFHRQTTMFMEVEG